MRLLNKTATLAGNDVIGEFRPPAHKMRDVIIEDIERADPCRVVLGSLFQAIPEQLESPRRHLAFFDMPRLAMPTEHTPFE